MKDFDEIWEEFNKQLFGFILSKVSNTHDAEDLLQDVFIKIHKNISKLKDDKAIKSWLYKITNNSIIDYYKKKKDLVMPSEEFSNLSVDEIEDNMNDIISQCMKEMLNYIPDKYQEVYELHEINGLKHKEIKDELDISISASRVRLKRGKDMLKDKLLKCCDFEVDKYGNIINYFPKDKGENEC